jgi:hypothetical protein
MKKEEYQVQDLNTKEQSNLSGGLLNYFTLYYLAEQCQTESQRAELLRMTSASLLGY